MCATEAEPDPLGALYSTSSFSHGLFFQAVAEQLEHWCRVAKNVHYKVEPELVGSLYRDWVMPLTKKVQVQYLLRRLDE